MMHTVNRSDVESLIDHAEVVSLMRRVFEEYAAGKVQLPDRAALDGRGQDDTVLIMPAAVPSVGGLGAKVISIFPSNAARGLPTVSSTVILLDAETGAVRAMLDGASITELRTSAVSALATDILSRKDAASLLVFGAGAQARHHILAIATVRDIKEVFVCSRTFGKAVSLCDDLGTVFGGRVTLEAVKDRAAAVGAADIIVTATTSRDPVFPGEHIRPGTHINAIGSYKPHVRELDDTAVLRSRVYVDMTEHALKEAGDLLDPIRRGVFPKEHIAGDLGQLLSGSCPGRQDDDEITLFKSVGAAMEDIIVGAVICDKAYGKHA